MNLPRIIQGGMGVAVSDWRLARTVSQLGQMGVVSGTGVDTVLVRRLQDGDPCGSVREALAAFPIQEIAQKILDRYFVPGGKPADKPYISKPLHAIDPGTPILDLTVVGNFCEVWLAKRGHQGVVGVNLLTKIQLPTLPSLFGAMLAGVDYVLMGAGIPRAIPGALDKLSKLEVTNLRIDVEGADSGEVYENVFDPSRYLPKGLTELIRPKFLAIVSSASLALNLAKKASGKVDGFIIEGWTAGGHNAPPRGAMTLSEKGEPIYGPRDEADLAAFRELGVPFWLAGSWGQPGKLEEALSEGAAGIQVGTAFAFCNESGINRDLKDRIIKAAQNKELEVFTDPLASPTGFPFKVVQLGESMSNDAVYEKRNRICDLGYLRSAYKMEDGKIGYRCASEPIDDFVRKGGDIKETCGRKCVCNGLMSTVSIPQVRKDGYVEPVLVTAGDRLVDLEEFCPKGQERYSAEDVIRILTAKVPARV